MSEWEEKNQDECAEYSLLLTAHFDGETGEGEALQVQSHLSQCESCARVWRAWTHNRFLLQSLPVQTVPQGLLARILLACRLSALLKPSARAEAAFLPPAQEAFGLPTSWGEVLRSDEAIIADAERKDFIISAASLPAPAPPPHLKAAILRRTVEATAAEAAAREAINTGRTLKAPSLHLNFDFWQGTRRALAASALPAAALWVIMLAQQSTIPLPSPVVSSVESSNGVEIAAATPDETTSQNDAEPMAANSMAELPPARVTEVVVVRSAPRVETSSNRMASNVSSNFEALANFASNPFPSFRETARPTNAASNAQRVATSNATTPRVAPQRVTATNPVAGANRTAQPQTQTVSNSHPSTPSPARAPLITMARWQPAAANSAIPVDVQKSNSIRRRTPTVTAPASSTPVRTAARLMMASLDTTEEMDNDVLEFISLARDSRPDEVREALDDFRAVLISSSWDD